MIEETSIAACGISCDSLFQQVCELSKTHRIEGYPTDLSIDRENDRFRLWARNIAALQDAQLPSSLSYRIRQDPKAQNMVKQTLKYLEESLQLCGYFPHFIIITYTELFSVSSASAYRRCYHIVISLD
jgi:hypothetical protein